MEANMKRCLAVARALVLAAAAVCLPAFVQETVCARVKIEIKQELTLERQAFDAEMRITNTLPATALERVDVDVWVTDEAGQPITITTDPNHLSASFFLRQTHTGALNSFPGDTLVLTPEGHRRIDSLKPGDEDARHSSGGHSWLT